MDYGLTTTGIESRWRPLSETETPVAAQRILDAEVLLDAIRPRLHELVAAGTVNPLFAQLAIFKAVKRTLANPDDVRGQNISPEGAIAVSFGTSSSSTVQLTDLYFLESDLVDLDRAVAVATGGAGRGAKSRRLSTYDEPVVDLYAFNAANRSAEL